MPTARPFAYNTGSTISGTLQYGNIAVGVNNIEYYNNYGGVQWWMGPNEDLGYVIAKTVPDGSQPNPLDIPAYVAFNRSDGFNSDSFLNIVNGLSLTSHTFTNSIDANNWLVSNGYWTSLNTDPILSIDSSRNESYPDTGNTITDLINSGYTGTKSNVGFDSTKNGGSFTFTSNSNRIEFSSFSADSTNYELSVFMWVYPTSYQSYSTSTYGWLINKRDNSSDKYWQMSIKNNYIATTLFRTGGYDAGSASDTDNPTISATTNQWNFVGFTTDGKSGGEIINYLNGQKDQSTTVQYDRHLGTRDLIIGTTSWNLGFLDFRGYIQSVKIYNRKLSAQEVEDLFNDDKDNFDLSGYVGGGGQTDSELGGDVKK